MIIELVAGDEMFTVVVEEIAMISVEKEKMRILLKGTDDPQYFTFDTADQARKAYDIITKTIGTMKGRLVLK